jgi:OmpA-OmpF porin, OOP family
MRILVIGFLALLTWSGISTYIYVCKIKGLCTEPKSIQMIAVDTAAISSEDTLSKLSVVEEAVSPGNLNIYFEFDKSDFSSDKSTDNYVSESNAYLDQNSQARLSIIGHTDAIGTEEYNQALGYRRAQTMAQYFEEKGMPADKILIESKGEQEPLADNNTNTGRSRNRRTSITIKE